MATNDGFRQTGAGGKTEKALIGSWHGVYPPAAFENVFVIGLAGLAGSGKTTVAIEIINQLQKEVPACQTLRLSFASRIKATIEALAGQKLQLDDQAQKMALFYEASDLTVRDFMLLFSFDFIRDRVGQNFWIDLTAQRLSQCRQPTITIIDDVRLPPEADLCRALGTAVLLKRHGAGTAGSHISEQPESLTIDQSIDNNAGVQQAARAIIALARKHSRWLQKT